MDFIIVAISVSEFQESYGGLMSSSPMDGLYYFCEDYGFLLHT